MSHPITHVKNANQHPGQIVLKTMQKHHTSKQKHQEDAHKMQEKHEQQGVQAHAIKQVAEIISEGIKVEKDLLRVCHQPKPCKAPLSQRQAAVTHSKQSHHEVDW